MFTSTARGILMLFLAIYGCIGICWDSLSPGVEKDGEAKRQAFERALAEFRKLHTAAKSIGSGG